MEPMVTFDLPEVKGEAAERLCVFKSRVATHWEQLQADAGLTAVALHVSHSPDGKSGRTDFESSAGPHHGSREHPRRFTRDVTLKDRAAQFKSVAPRYTFQRLLLPESTMRALKRGADSLLLEKAIYDEWGLREIDPNPRSVLNLHGPPGTGKSLAAHAVASYLGRPILPVSSADVDSMFRGEAPKNITALFFAAERDGALLFFDEADSLVSRRFSGASQASEEGSNQIKSQMLISLEQFSGIVVLSTNLVSSYDPAFETRMRSVRFELPDKACRLAIWKLHLPPRLPLADDVNVQRLAEIDTLCGRDIREVVKEAATEALVNGETEVRMQRFLDAVEEIKISRFSQKTSSPCSERLTVEESRIVAQAIESA